MNKLTQSNRCLSVKDTADMISLSRSSLYAMLADQNGDFPRPLKLGRRTCFLEAEVESWILSRPRVVSKSKSGGV